MMKDTVVAIELKRKYGYLSTKSRQNIIILPVLSIIVKHHRCVLKVMSSARALSRDWVSGHQATVVTSATTIAALHRNRSSS